MSGPPARPARAFRMPGDLPAIEHGRHARVIERGTPGAVALLHRAAAAIEAGADPAAWWRMLREAPGNPERSAVLHALDATDGGPLTVDRCRRAAAVLTPDKGYYPQ